eukprot:8158284-Alexandrium_andersonii.AAC.1
MTGRQLNELQWGPRADAPHPAAPASCRYPEIGEQWEVSDELPEAPPGGKDVSFARPAAASGLDFAGQRGLAVLRIQSFWRRRRPARPPAPP